MASSNFAATLLVTGSNGQLGSEIRTIATHYPGCRFLFTSKEDLSIADTGAVDAFFRKHPVDYCINCAAYTAVDKAESEPGVAFSINATAVGELARICKRQSAKLIHISTDYVYDGSAREALKEDSPVGPLNQYGASKLKGEQLALQNDSNALVIRTSWVYSSFGNNFVKTMIRLLSEKQEISVVDDQLGSPTYAANLAGVIMELIERTEEGKAFNGIVNYADAGVTTWYGFAEAIKSIIKSDCKINPVPSSAYKTAAKRPYYSVLDTSKIRGWLSSDIPAWQTGLKKCIDILTAK